MVMMIMTVAVTLTMMGMTMTMTMTTKDVVIMFGQVTIFLRFPLTACLEQRHQSEEG
jgi:hypothetical protein